MYDPPRLVSINTINRSYGYNQLSMGITTCTLLVNVNIGVNALAVANAAAVVLIEVGTSGSPSVNTYLPILADPELPAQAGDRTTLGLPNRQASNQATGQRA